MKHYAKILDGKVAKVIVFDQDGFADFVDDSPGQWVETPSIIGVGYTYEDGKFLPPQPFKSWVLTASNEWTAPKQYPDDGSSYRWDEESLSWVSENL